MALLAFKPTLVRRYRRDNMLGGATLRGAEIRQMVLARLATVRLDFHFVDGQHLLDHGLLLLHDVQRGLERLRSRGIDGRRVCRAGRQQRLSLLHGCMYLCHIFM